MSETHVAYNQADCVFPIASAVSSASSDLNTYADHARDDIDRFYELLARWRSETVYSSSMREKIENGAFQEIVNIGRADRRTIIPLIVKEIESKPDFLVVSLQLITGQNEAPPSAQGKIEEIVDAWISWAERTGMNAD